MISIKQASRKELGSTPGPFGDRVQLQLVALNLIMNGVEAMAHPMNGQRRLQISSTNHESGGVHVAIADSGPGLDLARADRIFEAFFTTKPEGMGIGLSICRSIIDAHGGRIWPSPYMARELSRG